MTRTRSGVWLFASLLAAGMLGVSLPAGAADAPAAQPADAVKAAQNLSQDQIQQIDQAVAAVANSMGDGSNPAAQSADRLWFASATKDSLGTPGSQQYLHTLALSANSHLLGVVKASDANFRAKIEAGLAAAALAGASHDTELAPLATALMQDSSAAIVLVGVKAAAAVQVPYILSKNNPAQQDVFLLAQMEQTVVQQPKPPEGGEIAVAVYDAMSNSIFGPVRANAAQISNLLVPIVLKLEGDRLPFYGQGAVAEPRADATGRVILLDLWNSLNQGQQKAAIDAAVKGISATGKLAETAQDKTMLQGLVAALQTDGKELKLYADPNNGAVPDQELYDAAIKLANLFPGSQPATISADAQAAASALAKH